MRQDNPRLEPTSAEERQAVATVQSAKQVMAEIEKLRMRVFDKRLPRETRRTAKKQLLEASERLCNLMALALYQITNGVNGEFQGRLQRVLEALRGRILNMGTNLILEKLQNVHDHAKEVMDGRSYPLGLASKLNQAFSNITSNLNALNAEERFEQKERNLMEETGQLIHTLADIEEKLGVLDELDDSFMR